MIKIAVYGKGGIGKSTTVSNVAVAVKVFIASASSSSFCACR